MSNITVSDSIKYIGADDLDIDLFESQYVVPNGISYNSYVILDDKITVMDTIDKRKTDEWLENLEKVLDGKKPDYLVVQHLEPDHAASLKILADKYPEMKLVGNVKTFAMIPQFFDIDLEGRKIVVKEGDTLNIGTHTLKFIMAPMVQYGFQVQALLKKAATLDIQMICPLHGPILKENLGYYINKYDIWSSYQPEDEGIFVAYASIHGNTATAAKQFAEMLREKGAVKVTVSDLSRSDMAENVEDAFRYNKLVLASASYDGGVFPVMQDFLLHLKAKNYQNRTIAIIENGSWAPSAARTMKGILETMKNLTVLDNVVTIKSTVKPETVTALETLADDIVKA